jgi:two-component system sensor histidine kinase/response regulator
MSAHNDNEPVADESSLFGTLPWPSAAVGLYGMLLAINPAFLAHFPFAVAGETSIDDLFEPGEDGVPASKSMLRPDDGSGAWQGMRKAKPGASDARFRVLVNKDAANPAVRWLFLPDNPVMQGRALLTPRSEFELTRMVLDHTPEFLFLREPGGGIIFASRALNRFLKSPGEGYEVGKPLANFLGADCAAEFAKLDHETLERRRTVHRSRLNFTTVHGDSRLLDLTQEPVYNAAGNLVGMLSFGRDITARVDRENKLHLALEEARTAGETKNFFVANVSHEIRTPINGILGMAELCLDTPLSPDQRKYLQAVLDCGRTLLTLVNDILDFSKVESGRVSFEHIDFDFARLLADTASQFAPRAYARRVEMVVDADPTLPARVKGDPIRVKQVIDNLVSNAVKFTEHGHVVVSSRILEKDDRHVRIAVDIADTGIGIAPEKQTQIFEAFTQADASTTRKFGGTGLGLAICKRLIEMMGGTLTVHSQPGVGSVFTAELPMEVASKDDITYGAPLQDRRIGVVSDDPVQRESLARLYRGLGAIVEESGASVDAFRFFLSGVHGATPVQLLVADYPVSGNEGHGMADILVGRGAAGGIPIITLGGLKSEPAVLTRLRSMPHRHIAKPAGHHDLRVATLALMGIEDPEVHEIKAGDEPPSRRLRVLLAEDNPVNQELAVRRLEKLGHQVDLAEDGGSAWKLLTSKRYDIAFLDVQMPVLDGLRLAKRVREMETGGAGRIPLVALTALAMDSDRQDCLDAGFDSLLTKPFLTEDLRRMIDSLVPVPAAEAGAPNKEPRRILVSPNVTRAPMPPRRDTFDFEAVLRALGEDEAEDMRFAGEVFIGYWEKEVAALHDAREKQDMRALALIAHRIKGGVGSLRGRLAAELSEKLEGAAKAGKNDETDALLRKLVDEMQVMADGIRRVLESGSRKP